MNDSRHDLFLVFEFVDTDLRKLIMSHQYLTIHHVKVILHQILCALFYMHSANVIHRDLKPANILINEDCGIKICDFGLARVLNDHDSIDDSDNRSKDINDSSDSYEGNYSTDEDLHAPPLLRRKMGMHVVIRWYRGIELQI